VLLIRTHGGSVPYAEKAYRQEETPTHRAKAKVWTRPAPTELANLINQWSTCKGSEDGNLAGVILDWLKEFPEEACKLDESLPLAGRKSFRLFLTLDGVLPPLKSRRKSRKS
jgi:hypothetical protein